jgi:hypothetical protein
MSALFALRHESGKTSSMPAPSPPTSGRWCVVYSAKRIGRPAAFRPQVGAACPFVGAAGTCHLAFVRRQSIPLARFVLNDRFLQALAVIAATILVGGGVLALLDRAGPGIDPRPSARAAAPSSASLPASSPATPAASDTGGPAIYRCDSAGKVLYSDSPCKGGRLVDMVVTEGYRPPGSADAPPGSPAPASTPRRAAAARAAQSDDTVECSMIAQAIASLDDAARRGAAAVDRDELRQRRSRLVERRQMLGC